MMERFAVEVIVAVALSVLSLICSLLGMYISVIYHLRMRRTVLEMRDMMMPVINRARASHDQENSFKVRGVSEAGATSTPDRDLSSSMQKLTSMSSDEQE